MKHPLLTTLFCLFPTLASAVPVNVALNQPAATDSVLNAGYPGGNAVDGNSTNDLSRWISDDSSFTHWIEIDLEQTYSLSQMKFWTGHTNGPFPLYNFALQYWDGSGWVNLYSETDSTNEGFVDASFGPTVAGNRIRLHSTFGQDRRVRLFEIEVYGEPHGLGYTTLTPAPRETLLDTDSDLSITFDAPIAVIDLTGIRVENLDTGVDVSGITASVSGSTLTVSHSGLGEITRYAVHVPAASVALASNSAVTNGAIYWTFETAPAQPQMVSYSNELPSPAGDIEVAFDRAVTIVDASGISLTRASDGAAVSAVSTSVTGGNTLALAHDPLVAEAAYIMVIPAGSLTGNVNGVGNAELRMAVYAGSSTPLSTTFSDGLEGFTMAYPTHFDPGDYGYASWIRNLVWRHSSGNGLGPALDNDFLVSRTNWKEDFILSPVLSLEAAREYTVDFRLYNERRLAVGLITTTAFAAATTPTEVLEATTELQAWANAGSRTVKHAFSPPLDDAYYLIFYSGNVDANQDQQIDSVNLTVAINPVVAFVSPNPSSSFLESDTVAINVEAYGISAPISDISLYINGEFERSMDKVDTLYSWEWIGHSPGEYTFSVVATDELGNTASSEISTTITFDDGTLPNFLGWSFEDGLQGWTGDESVATANDPYRAQSKALVQSLAKRANPWASSPEVFLSAGEPYTLKFLQFDNDPPPSPTYTYRVRVAEDPGRPASADLLDNDYTFNTNKNLEAWIAEEFTFTVPTDGGYYFTFYDNSSNDSGSGLSRLGLDDVRLFGNFNSVPSAEITVPNSAITTIADADITLSISATDVDGTIVQVELIDLETGNRIAPDAILTTAPYTYTWVPDTAGIFQVAARVTDDGNAFFISDPVTINVAPNQYTISTFLGGSATDEAFTGATYLSDRTLVMSGIIDPNLFPNVTPIYLNGATVGDRGVVVRLSEDGQSCLSVSVVGTRALDIDTDGSDRIFVAAGGDGAVVLNSAASTILWSNIYGSSNVHRIDAAKDGTFAVLTSGTFDYLDEKINSGTNYVYNSSYLELGTMGGVGAFTTDLAVDDASQTVVFIGWKNITHMEGPAGDSSINPVDIPGMVGRAYDGTLKWRAYDWEQKGSGNRFLNLITNNMADTRGSRVIIGPDNNIYAGIEFDGGNTPLRYDPFDLTKTVSVVGGDNYHSMSNTSTVPKTFVGRYDPATGAYETGQWITNRTSSGGDNTIRIKNGNLFVDTAGRIHVVGGSAAGLPLTHDPLSGVNYTGGAFHIVYSPDFTSREFVSRLTLSASGGLSHYAAIAQGPSGAIVTAGRTNSPRLFDVNPWQTDINSSYDAHFAVGNLDPYYKFQTGVHPRLFLSENELQAVRSRLGNEPYASMLTSLIANRDLGMFSRTYDPSNARDLLLRASNSAFIYALTTDESYALDARNDVQSAWNIIGANWASESEGGLVLYWNATKLAIAYDLCANSDAWDAGFNYEASNRLREIAVVIENNGGTGQPNDFTSNWAAARGSAAGLALLATDHKYNESLLTNSHNRTVNFLNANQGTGATRGWNPEGFGYTAFAIGSYLGPYAIAAKRNGAGDLTTHTGLQWMPWTGFAGATTAMDIYRHGGVKTDWSDDNAHVGGEGIYGLAFELAPDVLLPGLKHAYDRFMGALSPLSAKWDAHRGGTFWSILYYPDDIHSQNPTEIWDWHVASSDRNGIGIFTFRNAYEDDDDILIQFKARLDAPNQAHDGPDGLGFRIIGLGDPFIVGGGRNLDIGELNQATIYPSDPNNNVTRNNNTGSLIGTPLVKSTGGGHVVASMALNNVGTTSHKRWFITDYDSTGTDADATIIVADTSSNGAYWQIPTFLDNTVTSFGNTFTITGTNGATLKGTILHPGGTPNITIGTKARGSGYTVKNVIAGNYNASLAQYDNDPIGFPLIEENRYLHIQGNGDGDFLVVMTMMKSGSHPPVSHTSGTVADAVIQVGNKNYALQADDVFYSTNANTPIAYAAPNATVTFDADGKGTLGGAAVQVIPYGGSAIAPVVSPNSEYTFMGWNKAFTQVVKSMTVTALYDAVASGFSNWIADPLYGLDPVDQDNDDNPDGDFFNNLFEYAFVLNPSIPDGEGVVSMRQESGNLILSYRIRDDASEITVTPKYSSDLSGSWTNIPTGNISTTGSGPNYTEYEATMPIGSDPLFLILEVTQN